MRNNNFDLLRLIAALGVFLSHGIYFFSGFSPSFFNRTQSLGSISVYIFFIVSGFLIFRSYQRDRSFLNFFKKRLLRIFPGLFVASFFSVFFIAWIATTGSKEDFLLRADVWEVFFSYASGLAHLHGIEGVFEDAVFPLSLNGSLWTIKYEIACYFLMFTYFSCNIFLNRDLKVIAIVALLFLLLILGDNFPAFKYMDIYSLSIFSFSFFLGVLAAHFNFDKFNRKYILLAFITLSISLFFFNDKRWIDVVININLLFIIIFVAFSKIKINMKNDISYGVYIYAFPIQQFVSIYALKNGYSIWWYFALMLTWILVMAILSWKLVESPAIQWAKK